MIKHLIKYIILKWKWRSKLKFDFSCNIGLKSTFEGMNQIHPYTDFQGQLGYGSYVASNSSINGLIGRFTSVGPYVRCNAGRHPYTYPFATTAPCFFSAESFKYQNGRTFAHRQCFDEFSYYDNDSKLAVKIGNDCWIGEGAFIVGGIKIEDGAVVLAHAVVTKDVPPYAIVGGVPAKIIGYRYSKEDIDFLLKIQWWSNSEDWFKQNWELLNNFRELKHYYLNKLNK